MQKLWASPIEPELVAETGGFTVRTLSRLIFPFYPWPLSILEGSDSMADCCTAGLDESDWSLQGGWFEARDIDFFFPTPEQQLWRVLVCNAIACAQSARIKDLTTI